MPTPDFGNALHDNRQLCPVNGARSHVLDQSTLLMVLNFRNFTQAPTHTFLENDDVDVAREA